ARTETVHKKSKGRRAGLAARPRLPPERRSSACCKRPPGNRQESASAEMRRGGPMRLAASLRLLLLPLLAVLRAAWSGCNSGPRMVLYCAQDQEFADKILADFHKKTGVEVAPKFDTEADKSVSLYVELVREKDRPRCDVFWNNEILSTIRLQRQGL